jgi:hypothetical protein
MVIKRTKKTKHPTDKSASVLQPLTHEKNTCYQAI